VRRPGIRPTPMNSLSTRINLITRMNATGRSRLYPA
jgi:hypothetical protein